MKIYVNVNAGHDGNGTEQMPFRHINDAAKIAQPGDEVWVAPVSNSGILSTRMNRIYIRIKIGRASCRERVSSSV